MGISHTYYSFTSNFFVLKSISMTDNSVKISNNTAYIPTRRYQTNKPLCEVNELYYYSSIFLLVGSVIRQKRLSVGSDIPPYNYCDLREENILNFLFNNKIYKTGTKRATFYIFLTPNHNFDKNWQVSRPMCETLRL